jgi:hypothetical protein
MHDFDSYILWLLEQDRQRTLSKYTAMYAQFRQEQARQPRRSLWRALGTCLHTLRRNIWALPTRFALPRPLTQDTSFPVQDSVTLESAPDPQGHSMAGQEKRGVAAGP